MSPSTTRALVGAGFLAGAGCSTVLGVDPNRYVAPKEDAAADRTDAEATPEDDAGLTLLDVASEALPPSAWDCLGGHNMPDPAMQVDTTVVVMDPVFNSISLGAVDGGSDLVTVSATWMPGVSVRTCALLDTQCTDEVSKPVLTDDAGRAEFSLTGAFNGFFSLHRADLIPWTLYPGRFVAGESVVNFPAYGITPGIFQTLAQSAGAKVSLAADGGVGHAVVTIYDCLDHQAQDVSVAYDNLGPQSVPYYFSNGLPAPAETQTDSYGLAGAVNVPVGTLKVTARLAANALLVGSISFDIRPGGLSYAFIRARSR
jgi:hypothetical protein